MATATITILSGKSTRGEELGCTGYQVYALALDASGAELHVSGPHDDGHAARRAVREWAEANGVVITGNFQPRAFTGADADIRANSPR